MPYLRTDIELESKPAADSQDVTEQKSEEQPSEEQKPRRVVRRRRNHA